MSLYDEYFNNLEFLKSQTRNARAKLIKDVRTNEAQPDKYYREKKAAELLAVRDYLDSVDRFLYAAENVIDRIQQNKLEQFFLLTRPQATAVVASRRRSFSITKALANSPGLLNAWNEQNKTVSVVSIVPLSHYQIRLTA